MPKPILLTVDDDPEVLRAVERDLRKKYADRYRVVRADSGASALQSLQTLKKRNEAVGLMLVDQRMPEMSGVEFLNKAIKYLSGRETRFADGLRRYRCCYSGHQSSTHSSLLVEAVGSAGRTTLSGAGRFAGRLASGLSPDLRWSAGARAIDGRRGPTRCAIFWLATKCRTGGLMQKRRSGTRKCAKLWIVAQQDCLKLPAAIFNDDSAHCPIRRRPSWRRSSDCA